MPIVPVPSCCLLCLETGTQNLLSHLCLIPLIPLSYSLPFPPHFALKCPLCGRRQGHFGLAACNSMAWLGGTVDRHFLYCGSTHCAHALHGLALFALAGNGRAGIASFCHIPAHLHNFLVDLSGQVNDSDNDSGGTVISFILLPSYLFSNSFFFS